MTSPSTPVNGAAAGLGDALAALREHFRSASRPIVDGFEALAAQLGRSPTAPRTLESLRAELHRVKGTAGSYGFHDASALAARLESRVTAWAADPALDYEQRATVTQHFASALRLAFDMPVAADQLPLLATAPRRRMALIGMSRDTGRALESAAGERGYLAEVLDATDWVQRDAADAVPHLLVMTREAAGAVRGTAVARWLPAIEVDESNAMANPAALFDRADRLLLATTWLRPTVLLVDDDHSILQIARYALGGDLRVVTIDSAVHLFETLEREQPVVLLFEARLPGFDAITFARTLRAMPVHRDLPIVLLGDRLDSAMRLAAYDAGVDELLTKPLVPLELRARVAQRIERLRVERLTSGLHAMTGIALPARAREAVTEYRALITAGRLATAILVRPRVRPTDASHTMAWLRESRRVASAMGATARFAVYRDDLALVLVLDAPEPLANRLLESLGRNKPGEAPEWEAVSDRGAGSETFLQ